MVAQIFIKGVMYLIAYTTRTDLQTQISEIRNS